MPTARNIADIKSNLLRPALTSHFEVQIPIPPSLTEEYLKANGLPGYRGSNKQGQLNLMCSEATLPGSSLATFDINDNFHGVTERRAYRRIYDDRIDLTFYVDVENYIPIRFFETWMKSIVGESVTESGGRPGSKLPNYFYRNNYPEGRGGYTADGLKVMKFERDYNKKILEYEFIKSFPISITSMPVSYDSSSLLKCTVSMTYIRYVLIPPGADPKHKDADQSPSAGFGDPALEQAVQRALDPLSGSGFSDPVAEARFQRLNNPQFTPGFFDSSLNNGYNAIFGPQTEVSITDFQ
jgi:hypothetical protein